MELKARLTQVVDTLVLGCTAHPGDIDSQPVDPDVLTRVMFDIVKHWETGYEPGGPNIAEARYTYCAALGVALVAGSSSSGGELIFAQMMAECLKEFMADILYYLTQKNTRGVAHAAELSACTHSLIDDED